jgi:hypothetical protein
MRLAVTLPNKAIELTGDSARFFPISKSSSCHPQLIAAVRQQNQE